MMAVERGEGEDMVICRMGDDVFVLDGRCPHMGGPLSMGNFLPPLIICPWHGWEFDCRTGKCTHSDSAAVRSYPTEVRGGDIYAEFPDA